ncbi:MAG: 30S ribosomal protein S20, partial [Balneolales bacterium]
MPQHKSAIKRVRQSLTRRLRNRDQRSQMRTYIKKVLISTDKTEAESHLKVAVSYLDKMGRKG